MSHTKQKINPNVHEIRLVGPEAIAAAEQIWTLAFRSNWPVDYARHDLTRIYGAFAEGELHAVLGVIDFDIFFNDKRTTAGGIAAVATLPGQRYQGLVNQLMRKSLADLHAMDVPFACLYPFSAHFYERLGFATTHHVQWLNVSTEHLKRVSKGGNARAWRLLPNGKLDDLLKVHDRVAAGRNLCLRKNADIFARMLNSPGREFKLFLHERGYMVWTMHQSQDDTLVVREFIYEDLDTYKDGLALLAQMEAPFKRIKLADYGHEPLLKMGMPYPDAAIKVDGDMMTRVVNMAAFERVLGRKLSSLHQLYDPLAITTDALAGTISPGQLLQNILGMWHSPDDGFPPELFAVAGGKPIFSREPF